MKNKILLATLLAIHSFVSIYSMQTKDKSDSLCKELCMLRADFCAKGSDAGAIIQEKIKNMQESELAFLREILQDDYNSYDEKQFYQVLKHNKNMWYESQVHYSENYFDKCSQPLLHIAIEKSSLTLLWYCLLWVSL